LSGGRLGGMGGGKARVRGGGVVVDDFLVYFLLYIYTFFMTL